MSIATKTGDNGSTGLMYNRRVSKTHARIEACGSIDELTSALGLARATANSDDLKEKIYRIQKNLILLMGEIATLPEDLARYRKDGFQSIQASMTAEFDKHIEELERANLTFKDWVIPGGNLASATLDMARSACRRAERHIVALKEQDELTNPEIQVYLNRLSDLLWLWGRWIEQQSKS